jgi:hypothetical protein
MGYVVDFPIVLHCSSLPLPSGLCAVEELVADVDWADVCAGAHALPLLRLSRRQLRLWLTS